MSEYTTPISTAFELQRNTIKQGQRVLKHSVEMQQNMNQAFLGNMSTQEDAQRQSVELSRKTLHTYLNTVESTVPGLAGPVNEIRTRVDEQYDALLDVHEDSFETAEGELQTGFHTYEEMTEGYLEMLSSQIEILLEAHEDIETQTIDSFEQVRGQIEEMQAEMERQTEQFQQRFEEQTEQFQQRFEEQIEQFEAMQEQAGESGNA